MQRLGLPLRGVEFANPTTTEDALFNTRDFLNSARAVIPNVESAVKNVNTVLGLATELEVSVGMRWYFEAHDLCCRLALGAKERGVDLSVDSTAGLVAALSPNESWEGNVRRATELVERGATSGLGRDVRNATAILEGMSVRDVLFAPEKDNPKVRAFYSNIACPRSSLDVTIDRHAIAMIRGEATGFVPRLTPEKYQLASRVISLVAEHKGILPHQLQAITWVTWRRLQGLGRVASDSGAGQLSLDL